MPVWSLPASDVGRHVPLRSPDGRERHRTRGPSWDPSRQSLGAGRRRLAPGRRHPPLARRYPPSMQGLASIPATLGRTATTVGIVAISTAVLSFVLNGIGA